MYKVGATIAAAAAATIIFGSAVASADTQTGEVGAVTLTASGTNDGVQIKITNNSSWYLDCYAYGENNAEAPGERAFITGIIRVPYSSPPTLYGVKGLAPGKYDVYWACTGTRGGAWGSDPSRFTDPLPAQRVAVGEEPGGAGSLGSIDSGSLNFKNGSLSLLLPWR